MSIFNHLRNTAIAAGAMLAAVPGIASGEEQRGETVEQPAFEVLREEGLMQLRRYAPTIEARLTVEAASAKAAANDAFMRLAGYIFGANAGGETIAMTAPVTTQASGPVTVSGARPDAQTGAQTDAPTEALTRPGAYTIAFTMPARWTLDSLPEPEDDGVTLDRVPQRDIAAWRKTGPLDDAQTEAAIDELIAFARKAGFTPAGPPMRAGYDGPSVPEAERRNEVMLPIEKTGG